jgi:hypothetical protein
MFFDVRALTSVFQLKMEEVIEDWRKLRNETLRAMYFSRNIISTIKSWWMQGAGLMVHVGKRRRLAGRA